MFLKAGEKAGKRLATAFTMKTKIEAAGFVNVREETYKVPVGEWAKNPLLKEAGKFDKQQLTEGMEGYAMFLKVYLSGNVSLLTSTGTYSRNLASPSRGRRKRFRSFWPRSDSI